MSPPSPTPWSEAWLDALASFSHPGRMRRGQQFADRRRIRHFEVIPGEVNADVKEGDRVYHTRLLITPLDDATWDRVVARLASQALYSARLLVGEMPPEVVQVFTEINAPLFPEASDLQASCTCPDWETPCKHIAALYYVLAERFDEDPFLLFLLRGRSKEQLLTMLRQQRQAAATVAAQTNTRGQTPPLAETIDAFWDIGPSLEDIVFRIIPPAIPLPQLKRLGPPPFPQINLFELLPPIYATVTDKALAWANEAHGGQP